MKLPCVSIISLVAVSGGCLALGAAPDVPDTETTALSAVNNDNGKKLAPRRARLADCEDKGTGSAWSRTVGYSWNYNLATPVETCINVDVLVIDMGEKSSLVAVLRLQCGIATEVYDCPCFVAKSFTSLVREAQVLDADMVVNFWVRLMSHADATLAL